MTLGIEVRDLTLRYGDVTALDDVSLELAGGGIYGLLGRNGSGKTSLLSVLAAFRRATSGTVLIGGQPVFENAAVAGRVCLVTESPDVGDASDRVTEALDTARYLRPGWDADYAAKLLDGFGIAPGSRIGDLSRGQRSALGIAIGLASRAPVTMFDESHLGMDAPSRQAFQDELLADVMAHPRTVIVSTHLIDEFAALFEQVVIIDRGRLLLHDETEAVRARGAVVTGNADAVEDLVRGRRVLEVRRLGRTASAVVYGPLDERDRLRARDAGLEVAPIPLQDLFAHLTSGQERTDEA